VYFNIRKFRSYGRLRHLHNPRYFGIARRDEYAKEGLWDFRLWKQWTWGDGDARWASPFGDGRPGWHIECSAISMHYLGESFDIHCGGADHIFPHHENEIAQSTAATGKPPANFWLHARHLTIGKRKMSKRTGNVLYVRQILREGVHKECLRFYLISERYRNRLDFTMEQLEKKVCECEQTGRAIARLKAITEPGNGRRGRAIASRMLAGFESAMDDDLNTRLAFRRIFREFRKIGMLIRQKRISQKDARDILRAMEKINAVLNVF
jgi:cysteinyl-tRNA synthetase